jgi:hypothetical protein
MWSRLVPAEQEEAMNAAHLRTYEMMLFERWVPVQKICSYGCVVESSGSLKEVFRANEWLAHKRLGNFTSVEADVQAWDVSALQDRFRFARFALLDDMQGSFRVAERLLAGGEITPKLLAAWPLLKEFREDERFEPLLAAHKST